MNKTWYECKVKFRKINEQGVYKIAIEAYLVDAISFTECEQRINEIMREYISEEFKVTNIKPVNYYEIFTIEGGGIWFKSKVYLIAYDEESGKEKKTNIYLLLQANNAKEAYENTISVMKETISDYTIPSISETKIIEVFPYLSS